MKQMNYENGIKTLMELETAMERAAQNAAFDLERDMAKKIKKHASPCCFRNSDDTCGIKRALKISVFNSKCCSDAGNCGFWQAARGF